MDNQEAPEDTSSGASAASWLSQAVCRSPEYPTSLFYPTRGKSTKPAKQVCYTCPVMEQCLEACMDEESWPGARRHGVRGGLDKRERKALWKSLGFTDPAEDEDNE